MKKLSFFVLLGLFSSILLSTSNKNFTPSFASSEEPVTIGTYFEAERVEETTKVYISLSQKSMVQEAGRTVYDSLLEPGTPGIMSTYAISNRYYYYATPSDGKIIAKHILKNNLESVITALRIMHSEATAFVSLTTNNLTISNRNNLILEYLRTLSSKYTGFLWTNVAGTLGNVVNTFHNFLTAFDTGGISLSDFFASFVEGAVNSSYSGIGEEFKNKHLYLINPIEGYPNVDLIHLFASFDSSMLQTGTSLLVNSGLEHCTIASLGSWAGDLQSFSNATKNSDIYNDFDIVDDAFNTNSTFSYEDLYADIDAFNMAINFNGNGSAGIYQIFENYYDTLTETERFNDFIYALCNESTATQNTIEEEFVFIVYELLCLGFNGIGVEPTSISPLDFFYMRTMMLVLNGMPPRDERIILANSFYQFIFMKAGINCE